MKTTEVLLAFKLDYDDPEVLDKMVRKLMSSLSQVTRERVEAVYLDKALVVATFNNPSLYTQ